MIAVLVTLAAIVGGFVVWVLRGWLDGRSAALNEQVEEALEGHRARERSEAVARNTQLELKWEENKKEAENVDPAATDAAFAALLRARARLRAISAGARSGGAVPPAEDP